MQSNLGSISKLKTEYHTDQLQYSLPIGSEFIPLNQFLDKKVSIEFTGTIQCIHCNRKIKKSFSQGYCFPCFNTLPETDMCILKPETCHFHKNTCRDSVWGQEHCFIPHTIYLANSSALKIGITRQRQQMTRWMDQGAIQALPIATAKTRLDAGLAEVTIAKLVADKTNWQRMLKNENETIDLIQKAKEIQPLLNDFLNVEISQTLDVINFNYPVLAYPKKVKAFNLDKDSKIEGILQGIKGQYLIFDSGVVNVRKYAGYEWKVDIAL